MAAAAIIDQYNKKFKVAIEKLNELISIIQRDRHLHVRQGVHGPNDYLFTLAKNHRHIGSNHIHIYVKDNKIAFHYANHDIKLKDESGNVLTFNNRQERYVRNPPEEGEYYMIDGDIESIINYLKNVLDEEEKRKEERDRQRKGIKSKSRKSMKMKKSKGMKKGKSMKRVRV